MAVAATAMRQILIDYARSRLAEKRGGGMRRLSFDEVEMAIGDSSSFASNHAELLVTVDESVRRLTRESERLGRIVECRFFGGLSLQGPRTHRHLARDGQARLTSRRPGSTAICGNRQVDERRAGTGSGLLAGDRAAASERGFLEEARRSSLHAEIRSLLACPMIPVPSSPARCDREDGRGAALGIADAIDARLGTTVGVYQSKACSARRNGSCLPRTGYLGSTDPWRSNFRHSPDLR
jgi:hypothetical protein